MRLGRPLITTAHCAVIDAKQSVGGDNKIESVVKQRTLSRKKQALINAETTV